MFAQIVILYITYLLQLPAWCKVLTFISIGFNLVRFGYGFCKGLNKIDDTE